MVIFGIFLTIIIRYGFTRNSFMLVDGWTGALFILLWLTVSHFSRKFRIGERVSFGRMIRSILYSNLIIMGLLSILIFSFHSIDYSKFMVLGSILTITVLEVLFAVVYSSILHSDFLMDWIGPEAFHAEILNGNGKQKKEDYPNGRFTRENGSLRKAIISESGEKASAWIMEKLDIRNPRTLLLATTTRFNVENQPDGYFTTIVNLKRINDIQRINKFFESVNEKLPEGGIFLGCGETYTLRKERILHKYPPVLNYIIYTIDFLIKRVVPKVKLTNKIYFLITRGKNRVISRTETLGRLYCCGFEVLEEENIGNLLYWKTRKIRTPFYDYHPTYGPVVRLRRVGKNGKEFNVYKLRTMHAYAEYVQGYVYDNNSLDEGGKFMDDFRVTTLGRFFRKFWLDELPMFINIIKGDMKIVGVRPLSKHYFELYCEDLQKRRIRFKPGLIPPYYAQFPTPKHLNEIQDNENTYLNEYEKHPFRTDVKYFFRAMHNIFIKRARSK